MGLFVGKAYAANVGNLLNSSNSDVVSAMNGGSSFVVSFMKYLEYFRLLCLVVAAGFLFLAAVSYMTDHQDYRKDGVWMKTAVGLFIVTAGLSILKYMIGVFVKV